MLKPEEIAEIEHEVSALPDRKAACISGLQVLQRHRGWVSDESLRGLAGVLGMDPTEVESIATFYNLIFRRPVGQNVILCCDSVSCWIMGADRVHRQLQQQLAIPFGGTTRDGRFTLLPIACLGACDRAPVLMINETLHTRVEPPLLPFLIEEYV